MLTKLAPIAAKDKLDDVIAVSLSAQNASMVGLDSSSMC